MSTIEKKQNARMKCHGSTLACKIAHKLPVNYVYENEIYVTRPENTERVTIEPASRVDWCSDCEFEHGYDCPKPKVEIKQKWWKIWK